MVFKVPLFDREIDTGLARSTRNRRNPARFQDYIPTSTVPTQIGRFLTKKQQLEAAKARADAIRSTHDPGPLSDEGSGGENDVADAPQQIVTNPDDFGVFRKYSTLSSHNPDDFDPFADTPSVPSGSRAPAAEPIGSDITVSTTGGDSDPFANSKNPTADLLLSWWTQGTADGAASLNRLAKNILDPHFEPAQLKDFNAVTALRQFEKDHFSSKPGSTLKLGDSWKRGKVTIRVPCTGHKQCEDEAPEFTVDGICYRDAAEVVAKELADPDSFKDIHIRPFEEWWRPTEASDPVRVYSEVYTSDAMLQLEKKLEETLKSTPGPHLETFIVSALLYSDGTNLAQFGHASLWPMYLYIGNASKYIRAQPNSFSAHHIAYLPTVRVLFVWLSAGCLIGYC